MSSVNPKRTSGKNKILIYIKSVLKPSSLRTNYGRYSIPDFQFNDYNSAKGILETAHESTTYQSTSINFTVTYPKS